MTWTDLIGYAASAAVLATFCMNTMCYLRLMAIGSNLLFICFGALANIHPVLLLHLALLPINVARLLNARASGEKDVCAISSIALAGKRPGLPKDVVAVDQIGTRRRVL